MDKLAFLIEYLAKYNGVTVSESDYSFSNFRALMNITMPFELSAEYLSIQDEYLRQKVHELGIVDVSALPKTKGKIILYRGDIVPLKADAIVTAGNDELLGCFIPNHKCIDNAIFSYAGLELRQEMMEKMKAQGHKEPLGQVKVSRGYNLPSKYIFHTVGPAISWKVKQEDKDALRDCYLSCLKKADEISLKSIVFPSISTGVFAFPIEEASRIALSTVDSYLKENPDTSLEIVVFDTYSEGDYDVYQRRIKEID